MFKKIISFIAVMSLSLTATSFVEPNELPIDKTIDIKELELNKENFFIVCYIHDIKFPDIVYAQARLESGNFKSKLFQTKNNFLGLYNSRINDFYEFEHWTDCLIGYKDLLQFKYKGDNNRETYFTFLKELPYAMDPNYITKIRNMAEN
jgi:hypothetical protein